MQFNEMNLPSSLQKAIANLQFLKTTDIQKEAIPVSLSNQDLIACAQTGSGKTAAYSIPLISKLIDNPESCGLILAPTRELAKQIADVIKSLSLQNPEIKFSLLVGGVDMFKQVRSLKRRPRILIATPGRMIDHLRRKSLALTKTQFLILDEGDRMLDMGFAPQLEEILRYLPTKRQTSLFTATLPPKVRQLAHSYLQTPVQISVGEESRPVESIKQEVKVVGPDKKNDVLLDELIQRKGLTIIFTKTQRRTEQVARFLSDFGHETACIHGGLSQGQRNRALDKFRQGKARVLVATDVASRGLDIPQIQHVINYDIPMVDEDYVHRIGRTARNGASGEALSLVSQFEASTWNALVRKFKIKNAEIAVEKKSKSGGGSGSGFRKKSRSNKRDETGFSRNKKKATFSRKKNDDRSDAPFSRKKKSGNFKKKKFNKNRRDY